MEDFDDILKDTASKPRTGEEEDKNQQSDANSNEGDRNDLREMLKSYRPGQISGHIPDETYPTVINIGLFGVTGVGKSAFINSLNFAVKGEYETVAAEASHAFMGSKSLFRDAVCLTDCIHVLDNRPMKDYSPRQIADSLIPQFSGRRGLDPRDKIRNGRVVHCPVFVSDFTCPPAGEDAMMDFLQHLLKTAYNNKDLQMMYVITNKESQRERFQTQLELLHSRIGIPRDNIWVFENYTEDDHEQDDVRSTEYLRFLLKCLDVAEGNIKYEIERPKETSSVWHLMINSKIVRCLLVAMIIHFIFMSQVGLNALPFIKRNS